MASTRKQVAKKSKKGAKRRTSLPVFKKSKKLSLKAVGRRKLVAAEQRKRIAAKVRGSTASSAFH